MDAKQVFRLPSILFGYGLIIAGFILFGGTLGTNVLVLNIVVSCIVFTQAAYFLIFPLVQLERPTHSEVGMLGIFLYVARFYALLAIGFMVAAFFYELSFTVQLFVQLVLLFLLIVGRFATLHAGSRVERRYEKEQQLTVGRESMRQAMTILLDAVIATPNLDAAIAQRLQALSDDIRYVSPSTEEMAIQTEMRFCQTAEAMKHLLNSSQPNAERLQESVSQLERLFKQRKQY